MTTGINVYTNFHFCLLCAVAYTVIVNDTNNASIWLSCTVNNTPVCVCKEFDLPVFLHYRCNLFCIVEISVCIAFCDETSVLRSRTGWHGCIAANWRGINSQSGCEGIPRLSLELHQINNLSLVLPHSNRLSILVDTRRFSIAPSRCRNTKAPDVTVYDAIMWQGESLLESEALSSPVASKAMSFIIYNRAVWGSPVI